MILVVGLVWILPGAVAAHEEVSFEMNPPHGDPVMLTAILKTPRDHGPFAAAAPNQDERKFAAVVLLHGCAGVIPNSNVWASKLERWGYVVLQVDSFGPRGQTNICASGPAAPTDTRLLDAYAAKSYLAGLPFVDAKRIAVIGWSHGGSATLDLVAGVRDEGRPGFDPFKAAVAFYPWCLGSMTHLEAPLLILIGEKDDWTPSGRCQQILLDGETGHKLTLKVYVGAYHAFDVMRPATMGQKGLHLEYDASAAEDAATQLEDFLRQHLQ
jgi:dienelactone hydrolase